MIRIGYIDPEKLENDKEIAMHNIKISDKYHNLMLFISSAYGWLNANPGTNFQDLESMLRANNLHTHLYAKPIVLDVDSKLGMPIFDENGKNKTEYKYECIFSCRPANDALNEVLMYWKTYQENFDGLKYAGCIIKEQKLENTDNKSDSVHLFNDKEQNLTNLISKNKKKIVIAEIDAGSIISDIEDRCKERFGKVCDHIMVAMNKNNEAIYGLFIDTEHDKGLISEYGYFINTKTKLLEIIDLRPILGC